MKRLIQAGALSLAFLSLSSQVEIPNENPAKTYSTPVKTPEQAELVELTPKIEPSKNIFAPENQFSHLESESSGSELEQRVIQIGKNLPKEYNLSWIIYDLKAEEKLVSINADEPMQCASMFKPFVALAYFHELKKGRLQYNQQDNLTAMIKYSNNKATNEMIRLIGGIENVQSILTKNYGDIFRQTKLVEEIPEEGRAYKNKASANDYLRFLYALWHHQLPYSQEILALMALPNNDMIKSKTNLPKSVSVYDKGGSTGLLTGDYGIVVFDEQNKQRHPYIFIGIIERNVEGFEKPGFKVSDKEFYAFRNRSVSSLRRISEIVYLWMSAR